MKASLDISKQRQGQFLKKPCFVQFEVQTNLQHLLSYLRKKIYLNNFQNTISHVKFSKEFESFTRVKALLKNC